MLLGHVSSRFGRRYYAHCVQIIREQLAAPEDNKPWVYLYDAIDCARRLVLHHNVDLLCEGRDFLESIIGLAMKTVGFSQSGLQRNGLRCLIDLLGCVLAPVLVACWVHVFFLCDRTNVFIFGRTWHRVERLLCCVEQGVVFRFFGTRPLI